MVNLFAFVSISVDWRIYNKCFKAFLAEVVTVTNRPFLMYQNLCLAPRLGGIKLILFIRQASQPSINFNISELVYSDTHADVSY